MISSTSNNTVCSINKSCDKQSYALYKFMKIVPTQVPESSSVWYFWSSLKRAYVLWSFRKPHNNSLRKFSIHFFSNTFDNSGKTLTGLLLALLLELSFSYTGVISDSFKEPGNLLFIMVSLIQLVVQKSKLHYFLVRLLESLHLWLYLRTSFSQLF